MKKYVLLPRSMRDAIAALRRVPASVCEAADEAEYKLQSLANLLAGKCERCADPIPIGCVLCATCADKAGP